MSRLLTIAVLVAAALGWLVFLRPPLLAGSVAYVIVSGNSMEPTLHSGDLVVVRRSGSYRRGDVVAFRIPEGQAGAGALVIHRIVGRSSMGGLALKGDNKSIPDPWHPSAGDVVGRRWLRIPRLGVWLAVIRYPLVLGAAAAIFAVITVLTWDGSTPAGGSRTVPERRTPERHRRVRRGDPAPWASPFQATSRLRESDMRAGS